MVKDNKINKQIEEKIFSVANYLRGNVDSDKINAALLMMILLRRVEQILEPYRKDMYKAYIKLENVLDEKAMSEFMSNLSHTPFYIASDLSLAKILESPENCYNLLTGYVRSFSANVIDALMGLQYETLFAQLNYAKALYPLVNSFVGLNLSPENISDADLYRIAAKVASPEQNKFSGNFASPELFSTLLRSILLKDENITSEVDIYDPVCGTGRMLIDVALEAKERITHVNGAVHVYGQDVSSVARSTSCILSMLIGEDTSHYVCADALQYGTFENRKFQYIVADPPMNLRWKAERYFSWNDPRFVAGLPAKNDATLLYMQHVISKMDPNGCRSAIFTSPSCLINGGVGSGESNIRKWMLDADLVDAIIALPKKVDRFSNVQRYLWILDNHKPENRQGKVCLLDCNRIIEDVDIDTSTDEKLVSEVARVLNGKRTADYAVEIPNKSFGIYQITLVSNKDKKKRLVSVPMSASVMDYLKAEGYMIKNASDVKVVRDDYALVPEEPSWSIDYPSTSAYYQIDFESFFTTIEETESSALLLTDVLSEAEEAEKLLHALQNQKQPAPSKVLTESGTAWYGKVPSYWKRTVGSSCFDAVPGRTETAPEFSDDETPYLSLPYLRGNAKVEKVSSLKKAIETNTLVSDKDTLVVKSGANAGEVIRGREGALSSTLFLVKPSEMAMLDAQYLSYFMLAAEPWFRSQLRGAAVLNLSIKTLQDMAFYLPPLSEQKIIAAYLDGICTKISRLEELGYVNPKLQQYRKSLIYEAVTGKFDLDSLD